jgi:GT2 family glycosyltransferase
MNVVPLGGPAHMLRKKLRTLQMAWRDRGARGVLAVADEKIRHSIVVRTGWELPSRGRPSPHVSLKFRDVPPSSTLVSCVVPVHDPPPRILEKCLSSVLTQTHKKWQLCICDDCSSNVDVLTILARYANLDPRITVVRPTGNLGIAGATNLAAEQATGEFLAFLDHDDELHPQALAEIAHAIDVDPTIDLLYTDEDKLERSGAHSDPFLKPDWSPEYLHSVMYLLHCLCIRRTLYLQLGGLRSEYDSAQDFDLALRASMLARSIHHIPRILYHWRKLEGSASVTMAAKPYAVDAGLRALADAAATMVPPARADHGLMPGTYRLRRDLSQRPPVTLAIISGDPVSEVEGRGRIRILANFIRSIVDRSTYPDYTVLVVDDGELSPETATLLEGCCGCRVSCARQDGAGFNFSRKVNFAVSHVETEHFVLLNDDLEVIAPDWIEALMDYAVEPGVAAVGARLFHADSRVQHAGVVCSSPGGPGHIFYRTPKDQIGYYGFSHVVRNYGAVTAAVFASTLSVFRDVGPFDEAFSHDFNDVDFCLRACSRGYRIVYTPFCELFHFEHASLARSKPDRGELSLFLERWRAWTECDPFYRRI